MGLPLKNTDIGYQADIEDRECFRLWPVDSPHHRCCSRCVMDTTDPLISFDKSGVCNHCRSYEKNAGVRKAFGPAAQKQLDDIIAKIKRDGRNKEYDCIAGVSGGVDSTYTVYKARQFGLRPLAVHFDNGWNSELAVSNIEKTLKKLDVDLYTYVIDWEEFKDLQLSFLKASTPDAEIPTDHAIYGLLLRMACKHKVKYILNGMNYSSEGIVLPAWAYGHADWRYIRSVQKQFGSRKLITYPYYSVPFLFYAFMIRRIQLVSILNYIPYDKQEATEALEREIGWRPYQGKHHESIYTRFFQSYILPKKFNIDKRKCHLSSLIFSNTGNMTRAKALQELQSDICPAALLRADKEYVVKKLGLSEDEFDALMDLPLKTFWDYSTNYRLIMFLKKVQHLFRKIGIFYK